MNHSFGGFSVLWTIFLVHICQAFLKVELIVCFTDIGNLIYFWLLKFSISVAGSTSLGFLTLHLHHFTPFYINDGSDKSEGRD